MTVTGNPADFTISNIRVTWGFPPSVEPEVIGNLTPTEVWQKLYLEERMRRIDDQFEGSHREWWLETAAASGWAMVVGLVVAWVLS